ncbi:MAG: hypothetical protein J5781_05920 [Clostridia bacterium]|nr:hypothetical protein [Clostridia bacterium]
MKKVLTALVCIVVCLLCFACGKAGALLTGKTDDNATEQGDNAHSSATLPLDSNKEVSYPLNANGDPYTLSTYVGFIEFGCYPQTIAHHRAVAEMSQTTDSTGYYYSTWDNEHYAKITKAKVYGKRFKFTDETLIAENETYYFKVEPIKWWVFFSGDMVGGAGGTVTLISDVILDSHEFCSDYTYDIFGDVSDVYYINDVTHNGQVVIANNWGYSDLRSWLNNDFLKKAFSVEQERLLCSRNTDFVTNVYKADDATEKIWVPSSAEMLAYKTLFSSLTSSLAGHYAPYLAQVSDYARCRDTFISIYPDYYGCGRYWTSTAIKPSDVKGVDDDKKAMVASYKAAFVACDNHDNSGAKGESVGSSYMGVRPVICMYTGDVTSLLKDIEE